MARTNLHKGYLTLQAAKAFALLDPDTKGATNVDGTKTIEEELAELRRESLFFEEEFSSRSSKKRREKLNDSIRENRSNFDERG